MTIHREAQDVAIIGAGIAGASAARALAERGIHARVFDKGRVPGGRAATRVRDASQFDHGAQYFTARDPAFRHQVQAWQRSGVVAEWHARLLAIDADGRREVSTDEARWVGVPAMHALAGDLLRGLDVCCGSRIVRTDRNDGGWWLHLQDGETQGPFAHLVCTLPAPQAADLFGDDPLAQIARSVSFAPCWALMVEFDTPLDVDFDGAFVNTGPLSWMARDSSKHGRPAGERWIVHAGTAFSQTHLEADATDVASLLLRAFFAAIDQPATVPVASRAHRWRYALAQPPLQCGALVDPARRIALGGDWCNGSRIEGAWLSGVILAEHVARWIDAARPA